MTDTTPDPDPEKPTKRKILQTCRFCGQNFGTRGITNHEKKCEKLAAAPPAKTPGPEEPPDPQPEQKNEPEKPPENGLKRLKRLKPPEEQKNPTEPETMTNEITTASGHVMKIIQDVAPAAAPAAIPAGKPPGFFDDARTQAETAQAVAKAVNNDGVQQVLKAFAGFLETSTAKMVGKVPGQAGQKQGN